MKHLCLKQRPVIGEPVFIVGFPKEFGINDRGELVRDADVDDNLRKNRLNPLMQVGRIEKIGNRVVIEPLIGSTALLGLSGAPVFSKKGRLIGIFVDRRHELWVSKITKRPTHKYRLEAIPFAGGVEKLLSRAGQQQAVVPGKLSND